MRTFTYSFQPDILAQIEDARALTPPEVLEARDSHSRSSSAVQGRISRLQAINPTFLSSNSQPTSIPTSAPIPSTRTNSLGQSYESFIASSNPSAASLRHRIRAASSHHPSVQSSQSSSSMSRPGSSNRPNHIPLPASTFTGRSPNGSPGPTPASPISPRSSFLPSFMRTRSRAATITNPNRVGSPSVEISNPLGGGTVKNQTSRDAGSNTTQAAGRDGGGVTRSISTPMSGGLIASSNGTANGTSSAVAASTSAAQSTPNPNRPPVKTHRIRLVPHLESSRSLAFDPVIRELMPISVPPGTTPAQAVSSLTNIGHTANGKPPALLLKIGRFTDKSALPVPNANAASLAGGTLGSGNASSAVNGKAATTGATGSNGIASGSANGNTSLTIAGGGGDVCSGKVAFKSKVVSRSHAEIWCESGGKFYIRDAASSSGTFLNHIRLSSPNTESRPTVLNDGDVLQLGVDYQGGHEDMFRCVKMRVELGREWQRAANEFNTNALKQLKALGGVTPDSKGKTTESSVASSSGKKSKASVTDCCICLFSVTVCQSLFIAPCSHVFHYKCIRPLLMQHHPGFSCPLCRTFANLEEDVETEDAWEIASRRASVISRRSSNHSIRFPTQNTEPAPPLPNQAGGPGTSIGLGGRSASVSDLLGGESGTASEDEGDVADPASMQRQVTAVAPPNLQADVDMPEEVRGEVEQVIPLNNPDTAGSIAAITNPRALGREMSIPIPIFDDSNLNSFSEAATPMNDTFLSTLAPSMHQRLDLAQRMDEVGKGSETLAEDAEREEVGGEGDIAGRGRRISEEGWMEIEREGLDARTPDGRRADIEMMFS